MKKRLIKILCFALTVLMVFSSSSVAFAKEKVTPVILVHGVGGSAVYENVGTKSESEIKNLGIGEVTGLLTQQGLLSQALRLLSSEVELDEDEFLNALGTYFKDNKFNFTKNGNPKSGQGVNNYWKGPLSKHKSYWQNATISEAAIAKQLCKTQGAKNVYCFNYDWRCDICETAKKLRKYVIDVKKQTKSKKVTLVGCSLGGAVLSAYMDAYKGKKDVKRYVFVNPAIGGVDVARMYALDIKINKKQVLKYLDGMQSANPGSTQQTIMKVVKALGDKRVAIAADNLAEFAKSKKNVNRLYNEVIKPWIGYIPALWECVPYNSFDKAVKEMSAIGFLDKNSGLYKKIKKYHGVQGRFKKNVKAVKKAGAEVAIIANYNEPGIPVTSKANNHIDGLIDTKYASGGATVAAYGKKLKGSNAKGKYVSPDKIINAKTCALPDNTWFIKDIQHMQFRSDTKAVKFIANLACGKVKLNIKAVKKKYKYSQFLKADENQKLTNVK